MKHLKSILGTLIIVLTLFSCAKEDIIESAELTTAFTYYQVDNNIILANGDIITAWNYEDNVPTPGQKYSVHCYPEENMFTVRSNSTIVEIKINGIVQVFTTNHKSYMIDFDKMWEYLQYSGAG